MSYTFEFIADTRFGGNKQKLKSMDKKLKKAIEPLVCVNIKDATGIRELNFPKEDYYNAKSSKQWRKKYIISKECTPPTWDEVMGKINKIQASVYDRY